MISDFRYQGRSFSYRIKVEDRLWMLQITLLEKMSNNGQKRKVVRDGRLTGFQ